AAQTRAAQTRAAQTRAAHAKAAHTARHIRRDGRRWLPVRSLAVALDRARQSVAVPRNSPVANVARPRADDVGSGIHCLGVAGPSGGFVAAWEVHRERILVPGKRAGACKATRHQDSESDNVPGSHDSRPQFFVESTAELRWPMI